MVEFSTWIRIGGALNLEKDLNIIIDKLDRHRISGIYVQASDSSVQSRGETYSEGSALGYDPLEFFMKKIVEYGFRGEIWHPVYADPSMRNLTDAFIPDVEDRSWICPTAESSTKIKLNLVEQLIREYDRYDGLNIDYIRCPSICPERKNGSRRFPECENGSDYVTDFVKKLRELLTKNGMTLSADVFVDRENSGTTSHESNRIHQNWGEWVKENYVDRIIAMIYTEDNNDLKERITVSKKIIQINPRVKLEIGLGVSTDRLSKLGPKEMMEQIKIVDDSDIDNVALFALHGLTDDHLEVIKNFI